MMTQSKGFIFLLLTLASTSIFAGDISRPNFILIFIDDMGWGDFSCFGNEDVETPYIDAIAAQGICFENFYVNSPICSSSRVAISTGQYPQRLGITSFLNNRKHNIERGMKQWLDPQTPMLARFLQKSGYATGHFGKWHMGGQRDVDDAPAISEYGFDESLTNFEGMGPKLLPLTKTLKDTGVIVEGRIWEGAETLGEGFIWTQRSVMTGGFVERSIEFINKAQKHHQPFYINLWPDDVHAPFYPSIENWPENDTGTHKRERYLRVLEEMDRQFKSLFERIQKDPALHDNTLIMICSDNGPAQHAGHAGPFRGYKAQLYEGGVRSPLVVWGPGILANDAKGTVNKRSIFSAIDLLPSILKLAGIEKSEGIHFDGEDLAETLIGNADESREAPIFFRRPPDRKSFYGDNNLPDLSVRNGKWKFYIDYDGSDVQLYDLGRDVGESQSVAEQHPELVQQLTKMVFEWNEQLPKDAGDPDYRSDF